MTTLPQGSGHSRWLLPVVAAAAVAIVVVVVMVVSTAGRNGPTRPPVLHLASVAGGSLALPAGSAAGGSDKGGAADTASNGSGWRLEGTLPQGPSSGQVHHLPAGSTTGVFVGALARALGMAGEPQHLKSGWYLTSGTTELSVSELAGQHWTYSNHGCIAGPVLDPQAGVACAIAEPAPPAAEPAPPAAEPAQPPAAEPAQPPAAEPAPPAAEPVPPNKGTPDVSGAPGGSGFNPPPKPASPALVAEPAPVQESVARKVAGPVLAAVGVNPDRATVDTVGGQSNVVFSPQVGASTILGLETWVSVDEDGQIVDASGWLATPTAGAPYPLVSARKAFDQLLRQPQPMMELSMAPCRIVPGSSGCAPTPDRVVTGATLGLTQAYGSGQDIMLVPAWLFTLRGELTPVAVVAVETLFLGEPEQPSPDGRPTGGGEPGSVGGGSGTNGSTQVTGGPAQVSPIR